MQKILFIINPISGKGKREQLSEIINGSFDKQEYECNIIYSEYAHQAKAIAEESAKKNYDIIVVGGGDGSINDVANGMLFSKIPIGIIPIGSGNGLAHFLKIPFGIAKACEVIKNKKMVDIDTINVSSGNLLINYTSIAGIGFDAHVALKFSKSKRRGLNSYLNIIINDYLNYTPKEYYLTIDHGEVMKVKAFMICFANSNQFGYNAAIAPHASITDGYIDIIVVKKVPLAILPVISPMLWTNNIDYSSYVKRYRARHIIVSNNTDKCMNVDGESYPTEDEIIIESNPKSLNVIIP